MVYGFKWLGLIETVWWLPSATAKSAAFRLWTHEKCPRQMEAMKRWVHEHNASIKSFEYLNIDMDGLERHIFGEQ